jgi:hypothetical protein
VVLEKDAVDEVEAVYEMDAVEGREVEDETEVDVVKEEAVEEKVEDEIEFVDERTAVDETELVGEAVVEDGVGDEPDAEYTLRELTDQYAFTKAEGLFWTYAWHVDASGEHTASVLHTLPAQSPQNVVSNTKVFGPPHENRCRSRQRILPGPPPNRWDPDCRW